MLWINLLAILLSPVVALSLGVWFQNRRMVRERKLNIFKMLMATRATPLAEAHVQALNLIDIEFTARSKEERAVRDAWRAFLDQATNANLAEKGAAERLEDLRVDLLSKMGQALGYDFDVTLIRRARYFPVSHDQAMKDFEAIRRGLASFLRGQIPPPDSLGSIHGPVGASPGQVVDRK